MPAPPPLSDAALAATGERACCKCWPPFGGRVPTEEAAPSAELARRSFVHRSGTRFGIQLVVADGELLVVDVGPGSYARCTEMNLPMARLSAILLTHFHSDHICELGEYLTMSWVPAARTRPLPEASLHAHASVRHLCTSLTASHFLSLGSSFARYPSRQAAIVDLIRISSAS